MGGVFGLFDEDKEVVDILLDPKPDRRLLSNVPDAQGERSNLDRRGHGTLDAQPRAAQPKPIPHIQAQETTPAQAIPVPEQVVKNPELDAQELWFARFLEQVQETREKALQSETPKQLPEQLSELQGHDSVALPSCEAGLLAAKKREQDVGEQWISQFLEQALAAHSSMLSAAEQKVNAADAGAGAQEAPYASASKNKARVRKIHRSEGLQELNDGAEHKHARKHKTTKPAAEAQTQQPLNVNISDIGVTVQMSCEGELYMKQTADGLVLNFRRGEGPWMPMNFNLQQGQDDRLHCEERP